jgi:hypothetical protein
MKIIRFQEELHASNSAMFKKAIYKLSGVKPQDRMAIINKAERHKKKLQKETDQDRKNVGIFSTIFLKISSPFEKKHKEETNPNGNSEF